ncbi:MAG: hypothetical protein H7Z21_15585 [Hymenobacter sp.]|nr:hypothetical protein [Hymenobacter sp.]
MPLAGSQAQPSLGFLIGKRVTSVVRLSKTPAATDASAQGGAAVVMTGPSEQVISRAFAVRKGKADDELLVEQLIQRVQMTVVSPLGKSEYDSNNSFERDLVTSALGQRYDPYVSKPRTSVYPTQTSTTAPAADPKFESVWTTNLPLLCGTNVVQGIVLARVPANPSPGSTWVDSVRSGQTTTVNQYKVVKKDDDLLTLTLASRLAPGVRQPQTSSSAGPGGTASATSTVNVVEYNGELRVRQVSGFVEEMHLTKHTSGVINAAGQSMTNEATAKVDLANTIR